MMSHDLFIVAESKHICQGFVSTNTEVGKRDPSNSPLSPFSLFRNAI